MQRASKIKATLRRGGAAIVVVTITGLHALHAHAEEIPSVFTPVRPAGMGGAFTGVANDESAIWTNPAGIGRARKARSRNAVHIAKFPNVIVGANTASRSFYSGFKSAQDSSVEEIVSSTDDLGGKPFWARAALFPVMIFDVGREAPMAVGLYSDTTMKAVIEKETPEEARVEAISDTGGVITFGLTNQGNRFNAALQVRPVTRYAYEGRFPSEDLVDKKAMQTRFEDGANSAQGVGIDLGMLYTVADFWYPTVGVSVFNLPTGCKEDYLNPFTEKSETVCGNLFRGDLKNEDALSVVDPTDLRVGLSITPRLGRKVAMRLALDAHNIPLGTAEQSYGLQGIEVSKMLHGGLELFFGNPLLIAPLSLRTGYSQGFVTMGATASLGFFTLEFATYGRDVSSGKKPVEDRRVLASMSFDF
jgi:hypothetical protein